MQYQGVGKPVDIQIALTSKCVKAPQYASGYPGGMVLFAADPVELIEGFAYRIDLGFSLGLPPGVGAIVSGHRPAMVGRGIFAATESLGADDRETVQVSLFCKRVSDGFSSSMFVLVAAGEPIAELTFVPLFRMRLNAVRELLSAPGKRPMPTFTNEQ